VRDVRVYILFLLRITDYYDLSCWDICIHIYMNMVSFPEVTKANLQNESTH
jgi:hypothetical protein